MREPITPGRLYARLSAEFRRRRSCAWCRLPLPLMVEREADDEPNWTLDAFGPGCTGCERLVRALTHEYQDRFDLHDPAGPPHAPPPAPPTLVPRRFP